MTTVGTLSVDLIAQTASFNSNIEKAARNLNSQTAKMNSALGKVSKNIAMMRAEAEGLALGLAIKGAANFVKQQLDMVGSLGEVAQQLGVTTRDLQVYREIGAQVGVTQEDMDRGLQKLTLSIGKASLGAKGQGDAFAQLGISVRNSSGQIKTAGQILPEIADGLSRIKDPAQRAAMEVAIFGKAGQKLDTVLTGGAKSIEAATRRAEELGLIIGDDLVQAADSAADSIDGMNRQLSANIATAVTKNAESITSLATAISLLTIKGLSLAANYPRISGALLGMALGSRFGVPGAAIGGVGGYVIADDAARSAADSSLDLKFRAGEMNKATARMNSLIAMNGRGAGNKTSGPYQLAKREFEKQRQLLGRAMYEAGKPPAAPAGIELPGVGIASPGGRSAGGRSATDRAVDEAKRNEEQFRDQLARANDQLLRAKRANAVNAIDLEALSFEMLRSEDGQVRAAIEAEVTAGKYSRAQADSLLAVQDKVLAQESLGIITQAQERQAREELDLKLAANDNQRDILSAQESLATTAAERRPLQLRLLELEKQEERLKLQAVLASTDATKAQKKIAQVRLAQLDAIYSERASGIERNTMGPLGELMRGIPKTAAEMSEAMQGVAANGIQSVTDGLADAITGARSLGDVFRGVANQIIADLIRIAVRRAVVGTLVNSIFGGGGGMPSIGSALADVGSKLTGSYSPLPGFAMGTSSAPSGLALVGESGPELVRFRGGEQVIPNHRLRGLEFGGRESSGVAVQVIPSPYFDVRVQHNISAAAPSIASAGGMVGQRRTAYRQSRRLA